MITALATLLLAASSTSALTAKSEHIHVASAKTASNARVAAEPADPAPADSWTDIPVQTRYVMIMGAMDAAAASRIMGSAAAPLCPGDLTNIDLDARLTADGYTANGEGLEAALRATIAKASKGATCDDTKRRYDVRLVSGMSDQHLSAYISQAVATLELPADCTLQRGNLQDMQDLAARLAGGILTVEDKEAKPVDQIAKTTAEACKQPREIAQPAEAETESESR